MSCQFWTTALAKIDPLYLESDQFLDSENKQVAVLGQVASGEQLDSLPALMDKAGVVVMNALDWQVFDLATYLSYLPCLLDTTLTMILGV